MDSADTSFPPAASAPAWLPAAIRPAVDALLYSSVLVAAAAASLTASTYLFWQRPLPPRLGLFVFAATLFLYNLDSILPYKYAQPTLLSARKRWMLAHRRVLLALALLSLACAGWLFVVELSWLGILVGQDAVEIIQEQRGREEAYKIVEKSIALYNETFGHTTQDAAQSAGVEL